MKRARARTRILKRVYGSANGARTYMATKKKEYISAESRKLKKKKRGSLTVRVVEGEVIYMPEGVLSRKWDDYIRSTRELRLSERASGWE